MGIVIPLPKGKAVPVKGLTGQECDAIQAEAYDLIIEGCATGIAIDDDGGYMCVLDRNGKPYTVCRENGLCYLLDPEDLILARSDRFEIVLDALEMTLSSSQDETGEP